MSPYKRSFLELAVDANALKFGEFTLKSGRVSPYFFNASAFSSGLQLQVLGRCYRDAIAEHGVAFDGLFGPAYKGIPLASSVAVAFADQGMDYPVSFNRKELKDHGEGGTLLARHRMGGFWQLMMWSQPEQPSESRSILLKIAVRVCVRFVLQLIGKSGAKRGLVLHLPSSPKPSSWSRCQL